MRAALTPEAIGRRLSLTRQALDLNQSHFADRAGLSQNQYNAFEKGKRRLSLDAALALTAEYGLTLDWLYFGDPSGLPYRLADRIREARKP